MSALQTGNTEQFADGTVASPSVKIGRNDTGLFIVRNTSGAPTRVGVAVAGVEQFGAPPLAAAPVDHAGAQTAVAATDTVTSNNTNVSDADTVTVNGKAYTFKTALTPAEGEILIGASADASLTNLANAINNSGGTPGTDYQVAAVHPTVSAAAVASHATVLSAKTAGAAGNALTLAKSAATLSLTGATFSGGSDAVASIDCTPGKAGQFAVYGGIVYVCLIDTTSSTTGAWKRVSTASL